jgi:methylase of polypeptide subunit release factors
VTVLAATPWRTNAEMIEAVVELGLIKPTDRIVDLTFGRGKWWTNYKHSGELWANVDPAADDSVLADIFARLGVQHWTCRDYTDADAWFTLRQQFDVVVFDPPYVSMGGRDTSTIPEFMDRYGLKVAAASPARLHDYNFEGMRVAYDLLRPGGFVMTKVMDYVSSGRLQPAAHWMYRDATDLLGMTLHERLIHLGHSRAQPPGRSQQHARNNYSMLYIFQKPSKGSR